MIWRGARDQKTKPTFGGALNLPYFLTSFSDGGV
jgi:hypothetical protein